MAKIMYIHHNAYLGGGSIIAANNVKLLSEKHEVVFYLPKQGSDLFSNYLNDLKIDCVRFATLPPSFSYYSGSSSLFAINTILKTFISSFNKKTWQKKIEKENPDVVMVNSSTLSPMGNVIKKANAKAVCFNWETFRPQKLNLGTRYVIRQLRNFDAVNFNSTHDMKYANLPGVRKSVFVNPVREDLFPEKTLSKDEACDLLKLDSKKINILYLGGFGKVKGPAQMLKSFALLTNHPEIHLLFAGQMHGLNVAKGIKGWLRALLGWDMYLHNRRLRLLINELKTQITILGLHKNVSLLYQAADVVVCPSASPHQLGPIFEAGLYKKPVVTTDFEQIKDYARDRDNGLLFPNGDYQALANTILTLSENKQLRNSLGENNYKNSMKYLDINSIRNSLFKIVEDVLPSTPSERADS